MNQSANYRYQVAVTTLNAILKEHQLTPQLEGLQTNWKDSAVASYRLVRDGMDIPSGVLQVTMKLEPLGGSASELEQAVKGHQGLYVGSNATIKELTLSYIPRPGVPMRPMHITVGQDGYDASSSVLRERGSLSSAACIMLKVVA